MSHSENRFPLFRDMCCLSRLLAVRLELLLEGGELGERRIRIGLAVAAVPALPAPFDIFRAQRRIALRAIAARRAIRTVAASRRVAIPPLGALLTIGTIR